MHTFVFDTETTGLLKPEASPLDEQPRIIELYGVKIDEEFNMIDEFEVLLNPGAPLDPIITKITGLTDDDLKDAPTFVDIYDDLADFLLGTEEMVAHNLAFDRDMLKHELMRMDKMLNFPWPKNHICTVEQSINIKGYRLKLEQLHQIAVGQGFESAHRAKNDVFALVRCFHYLREHGIA